MQRANRRSALTCDARRIGGKNVDINRNPELAKRVERALLRAGESARRTARMYGTLLYVWENGQLMRSDHRVQMNAGDITSFDPRTRNSEPD